MKSARLFMILIFLVSGFSAASHGYGAFSGPAQNIASVDMPCCPPASDAHHRQSDRNMVACHYCCVTILAILAAPAIADLSGPVAAYSRPQKVLVSEYAYGLFKPPRSFG